MAKPINNSPLGFWNRWINKSEYDQLDLLENLAGVSKVGEDGKFTNKIMTATLLRSYLIDFWNVPMEWGLKQAKDRDRWMLCALKRKGEIDHLKAESKKETLIEARVRFKREFPEAELITIHRNNQREDSRYCPTNEQIQQVARLYRMWDAFTVGAGFKGEKFED